MTADTHQNAAIETVVDGFDELTIRQLRRQLDFLSERELRALRRYEATHRSRRTLLRVIDARLQPCTH
jgi:hypothetical protein